MDSAFPAIIKDRKLPNFLTFHDVLRADRRSIVAFQDGEELATEVNSEMSPTERSLTHGEGGWFQALVEEALVGLIDERQEGGGPDDTASESGES